MDIRTQPYIEADVNRTKKAERSLANVAKQAGCSIKFPRKQKEMYLNLEGHLDDPGMKESNKKVIMIQLRLYNTWQNFRRVYLET